MEAQEGLDPWLRDFEEAMRLTDDVASRIQEIEGRTRSGEDVSRVIHSARKRIRRLTATADKLEEVLNNGQDADGITEKELYRRRDMVMGIRYRARSQAAMLPAQSSQPAGSWSPLTPTQPSRWDRAGPSEEGASSTRELRAEDSEVQPKEASDGSSTDKHMVLEVRDTPASLHQCLLETDPGHEAELSDASRTESGMLVWMKQQAGRHYQCPGRPSRAFHSSLKVNISANTQRGQRKQTPGQRREAQGNDIDQTRLQHAVTRADTLFAEHVALDGTKAVERHLFAARKAKLQHRNVTTKQRGVYEAIREIPEILPLKWRQQRNKHLACPPNTSRRLPTTRVPKPAPPPMVHNPTWRKQHRADTPRPPGFGDNRRVHFAPPARLHQGPVYPTQPVFRRLDKQTYRGPYQPAPYRPPQLFPKYPQYRQPYPQQYQQQPFRKLTWKSNNYYEPLN
ncbi:syntaxin 51-like partial [Klebsormidium nitens]|uniref:Syntaxin 51-like partial n=1 Tax=Klebsormidium nitens TaxID=105231 RepID=A0A1Y1IQS1_KLENI|nr:syntaxin 51-like partial [Klebsormidium nitens]